MRSASLVRLAVASMVLASVTGCQEDPVIPSSDLRPTLEVSNPTLRFTESLQTARIDYTVRDGRGEPVLRPFVTFTSEEPRVATVTPDGIVQAHANGTTTITVQSVTARSVVSVEVEAAPIVFSMDVPLEPLSAPLGAWRYLSFEVPAGPSDRLLEVRLGGGVGDPELTLFYQSTTAPVCQSQARVQGLDGCGLLHPPAGTYSVGLHARGGFQGVALETRLVPVTALSDGVAQTGLSAAQGELTYFSIEAPAGSTVDLAATGSSGDVDLFGSHFGTDWTAFSLMYLYNMDSVDSWGWLPGGCSSVSGTTSEACTVPMAAELDTVLVVLHAVEAFADLSLTAHVRP